MRSKTSLAQRPSITRDDLARRAPNWQWLTSACVLIASAFFAGPTLCAHDATPNIVLIISDDQAWNDYGFMGHPEIQTPHLDQLARESVVFPNGYVPTALCRPSLMTLLTGHYASVHGVTGNDPSPRYNKGNPEKQRQQRDQLIGYVDKFPTLPAALGKQGFLSHQSGKLWEGSYQRSGFTHGMTRGFPNPGGRHGDAGLAIGRQGMQPIKDFLAAALNGHEKSESETGQEKPTRQPFFLWYAPFLPHSPHNPPERLLKKYRAADRPITIARYYAMCEWFDETCGVLLQMLEDHGVADNTLVVYVTDNGWIQRPDSSGYAPRSKQSAYEGGVRTPILFRWPKKIPPAKREDLVSSIDLYPTMLAAAGAPLPEDLPGLNLLPMLEEGSAIPRDLIFGEGFAHDIANIDDPEASLLYRWCIEGKPTSRQRWKLLLTYDGEVNRYQSTHPREERRPQLFDLIADPGEQTNLAAEHPQIVERLATRIQKWYPVTKRKTLTTFSADSRDTSHQP